MSNQPVPYLAPRPDDRITTANVMRRSAVSETDNAPVDSTSSSSMSRAEPLDAYRAVREGRSDPRLSQSTVNDATVSSAAGARKRRKQARAAPDCESQRPESDRTTRVFAAFGTQRQGQTRQVVGAVRGTPSRPGRRTGDKQPPRELMKLKEAADYLRCSPWRLRNLLHDGRLPFLQDGGGPMYIDRRDLDLYIDHNKRYG